MHQNSFLIITINIGCPQKPKTTLGTSVSNVYSISEFECILTVICVL